MDRTKDPFDIYGLAVLTIIMLRLELHELLELVSLEGLFSHERLTLTLTIDIDG